METIENIEKPGNQLAKIIAGLVVIALVVVFSLQNSGVTLVRFLVWEGNAPLVLLFLLCFAIGLSFSVILIVPINRHSKRKSKLISELNARVELLESQLKAKQF